MGQALAAGPRPGFLGKRFKAGNVAPSAPECIKAHGLVHPNPNPVFASLGAIQKAFSNLFGTARQPHVRYSGGHRGCSLFALEHRIEWAFAALVPVVRFFSSSNTQTDGIIQ